MKDVLVVVPARGGSKRLPGKNLRLLGGRSLLAHTAEFLAREGYLGQSILSTDSEEIAEEGRRCGLNVPFMRPAELACDAATTLSVVVHALEHYRAIHGGDPLFVAVLQPTSPFRRQGLLSEAVGLLSGDDASGSVVGMARLHVNSRYVFVRTPQGDHVVPISQEGAPALAPSGSMYVTRTSALRKQGDIYAQPILAIEVAGGEAMDIDTEDDLLLAECMLRHHRHNVIVPGLNG